MVRSAGCLYDGAFHKVPAPVMRAGDTAGPGVAIKYMGIRMLMCDYLVDTLRQLKNPCKYAIPRRLTDNLSRFFDYSLAILKLQH